MATRSYILLKSKNSYEGIYCHNDGYPEYNGVLLQRHYNKMIKIKKLLSLGNISSLRSKYFPRKTHSFYAPLHDVTVSYHRDRNEDFDNVSLQYNDLQISLEDDIDYIYIFENGKWNCFDRFGKVSIPNTF